MKREHNIMDEGKMESPLVGPVQKEGSLIGVVLDLSESMRISVRNNRNGQVSRIASLSQEFLHVVEDARLAMSTAETGEEISLRMFIHGFGFLPERNQTWTDPIGDVFSIVSNLNLQINHYKVLQPELENVWLGEVERMLNQGRVEGDAKEELRVFVKNELKEQAVQAEKQRSIAKFQIWCASVCQQIDTYSAGLRTRAARRKRIAHILIPMIIVLQWILRIPMLLMAYLNKLFEAWLQQKLIALQVNADKYASQQSEKVVSLTQKAVTRYHEKISSTTRGAIKKFLDEEALKVVHSFDLQGSADVVRQQFDRRELENVYKDVLNQIHTIMSPHVDSSWEHSIFLLKRASKALRIKPRWDILKEKTILCVHQIVWEMITPEISDMAKALAKERFTRAILSTIVRRLKNQESTLSLQEIVTLLQNNDGVQVTSEELPIFGSSPLGLALTRTFNRLWHEAHLPQNKGLCPAIVIISDGQPTDSDNVDLPILADKIKQLGIPIVCCFVTNRNTGRPWHLPRHPGLFWSSAAQLMFSMASTVEEYTALADRLQDSRFVIKKQARLFIQLNHTDYLRGFIEAALLPVQKERRAIEQVQLVNRFD